MLYLLCLFFILMKVILHFLGVGMGSDYVEHDHGRT